MSVLSACVDANAAPFSTHSPAPWACARGDTVFEAGQAARLWRVVSGVLSLVQRDHGAQHLMSLALPGDLLGIEALCQGLHTLPHQLRTGPVLPRVAALLKVLGHAAALVGQPADADRLRESLPPLRELALVVDAKAETVCRALAQLLPPRSRKSGPRGWAAAGAAASASARAAAQALGLAPTPPIGGALA